MTNNIHVHYLEVVTPDTEQVCNAYALAFKVEFSEVVPELGGARTATIAGGGTIGIRAPMHDGETPITRPYFLVDNIKSTIEEAQRSGAELIVPPMEIPGRGICALISHDTIQSGFWQR